MEHLINAKSKNLGRLATQIAVILQGKNSPRYAPNKIGLDTVRVQNIKALKVSGRKSSQKLYRRHTGYIGGLKSHTYEEVFAKNPAAILKSAVRGMLPANRLRAPRLKNLIIE